MKKAVSHPAFRRTPAMPLQRAVKASETWTENWYAAQEGAAVAAAAEVESGVSAMVMVSVTGPRQNTGRWYPSCSIPHRCFLQVKTAPHTDNVYIPLLSTMAKNGGGAALRGLSVPGAILLLPQKSCKMPDQPHFCCPSWLLPGAVRPLATPLGSGDTGSELLTAIKSP